MPLVTAKELLGKAMREGYAVPAFNANCLEMIPALVRAAQLEQAPLIVQIGKKYLGYQEPGEIAVYARYLADRASVPVCIHLDHGASKEMVRQCLEAGYTSIMYDGSALPLSENIRNTREVVRMASAYGVPVEGEIGQVLQADQVDCLEDPGEMTDPETAAYFVEHTGVDSVAVAVGNVHRMLQKEACIDFERIRKIRNKVPVPLVIHGSSGIADADVGRMVALGINKINVATEFNREFVRKAGAFLAEHPGEIFPMEPLGAAMEAVTVLARTRIRVVGAAGRG